MLRKFYQTVIPLSVRNSIYRLRVRTHKVLLPIISRLPFSRGAEGLNMPSQSSTLAMTLIEEIRAKGGVIVDVRHREKLITIAGIHIAAETYQDIFIVNEVFTHNLYDILSSQSVVVLDVGMNVGIATCLWL
jgi:hypothetical protein